jgi:hypothetical protein
MEEQATVMDLIFAITSFAERKRVNWLQCSGIISERHCELYNCRKSFKSEDLDIELMDRFVFPEFLETCLISATVDDLEYKTYLCQAYISGLDYTINAKIVLWNSILEKILKKNFQKKNDPLKETLISRLCIQHQDLATIKELMRIRNDVAHGDHVDNERLFRLGRDWEVLIERAIINELGWSEIHKTRLKVRGS